MPLLARASHEKTRCFHSWTRLGIDSGRLHALPDAPGRSFWCHGASLETLGLLPETPEDAPGTLLRATGHTERVPQPILNRF